MLAAILHPFSLLDQSCFTASGILLFLFLINPGGFDLLMAGGLLTMRLLDSPIYLLFF